MAIRTTYSRDSPVVLPPAPARHTARPHAPPTRRGSQRPQRDPPRTGPSSAHPRYAQRTEESSRIAPDRRSAAVLHLVLLPSADAVRYTQRRRPGGAGAATSSRSNRRQFAGNRKLPQPKVPKSDCRVSLSTGGPIWAHTSNNLEIPVCWRHVEDNNARAAI